MNSRQTFWTGMSGTAEQPIREISKPKTLISKQEVRLQIDEVATNLADYLTRQIGDEDLVVISVLTGGVYFAIDIDRMLGTRRPGLRTTMHYLHLQRGGVASPYELMRTFEERDVRSKNVVLVDDIIDTGLTLRYAVDQIGQYRPNSIETVSLLWKPKQTLGNFRPNWCCFQINDVCVSGYGMDDLDGRYRNLQRIVYWPEDDQFGEYQSLPPYRLD